MDMDVVGNKERLLKGILDGEATTDIEPVGNKERLLYGILKGETESNIEPVGHEEILLKGILYKLAQDGGGAVKKHMAGTIAAPFSPEEGIKIWDSINDGTGDADIAFSVIGFGSILANFTTAGDAIGGRLLLANLAAPVGNNFAALGLVYFVSETGIQLMKKHVYAIDPDNLTVEDASVLVSDNLSTITILTTYNTELVLDSLDATYNGTYNAPDGVAFDPVTVNVAPNVGSKSITANGNYSSSSDNLDGYSSVTVNVAAVSKLPQVADKTVTEIAAADLAGATELGNYIFHSCSSLVSITIPSGVTNIGNYAFNGCLNLASISIPSSVTSIGKSAFYSCTKLASATVEATTPPTLGTNAFSLTDDDFVIYVPAASVSAYQSATNWSMYASKIQAIPQS